MLGQITCPCARESTRIEKHSHRAVVQMASGFHVWNSKREHSLVPLNILYTFHFLFFLVLVENHSICSEANRQQLRTWNFSNERPRQYVRNNALVAWFFPHSFSSTIAQFMEILFIKWNGSFMEIIINNNKGKIQESLQHLRAFGGTVMYAFIWFSNEKYCASTATENELYIIRLRWIRAGASMCEE